MKYQDLGISYNDLASVKFRIRNLLLLAYVHVCQMLNITGVHTQTPSLNLASLSIIKTLIKLSATCIFYLP
jgi:hypothetical protein